MDATSYAQSGDQPGGDEIWGSYQHQHDRNLDTTDVFHKTTFFNLQARWRRAFEGRTPGGLFAGGALGDWRQ